MRGQRDAEGRFSAASHRAGTRCELRLIEAEIQGLKSRNSESRLRNPEGVGRVPDRSLAGLVAEDKVAAVK